MRGACGVEIGRVGWEFLFGERKATDWYWNEVIVQTDCCGNGSVEMVGHD